MRGTSLMFWAAIAVGAWWVWDQHQRALFAGRAVQGLEALDVTPAYSEGVS